MKLTTLLLKTITAPPVTTLLNPRSNLGRREILTSSSDEVDVLESRRRSVFGGFNDDVTPVGDGKSRKQTPLQQLLYNLIHPVVDRDSLSDVELNGSPKGKEGGKVSSATIPLESIGDDDDISQKPKPKPKPKPSNKPKPSDNPNPKLEIQQVELEKVDDEESKHDELEGVISNVNNDQADASNEELPPHRVDKKPQPPKRTKEEVEKELQELINSKGKKPK